MAALISIFTEPQAIHGVASVTAEGIKMVVVFNNNKKATIERSPLSDFSKRELFNVYFPSEHNEKFTAEVAPNKSASEVITLLNKLAAKAAYDVARADRGEIVVILFDIGSQFKVFQLNN